MNSRALFDSLTEENSDLKGRIQALERENRGLKKSVFQLSALTSLQAAQIKKLTRSRGIADLGAVPPSVTPATMWLGNTPAASTVRTIVVLIQLALRLVHTTLAF
jgi:hypothetical protein